MIIVDSVTYGQIIVPFTQDQSEKLSTNISIYSRDNTSNNVRDSVGTGGVINLNGYRFNCLINDNDGGIVSSVGFLSKYKIPQIRANLKSIQQTSEIITLIFGVSNSLFLGLNDPIVIKNCVIKDMDFDANNETGRGYKLQIEFTELILVDSVWNPAVINSPPGKNNRSKKALTPQNNGVSDPYLATDQALQQNLSADTGGLFPAPR